jgi:hypothetical protein
MASFQACCVSSPGLRAYARAALFAARRAAMHSTVIAALSMTGEKRPNAYRAAMVWRARTGILSSRPMASSRSLCFRKPMAIS